MNEWRLHEGGWEEVVSCVRLGNIDCVAVWAFDKQYRKNIVSLGSSKEG